MKRTFRIPVTIDGIKQDVEVLPRVVLSQELGKRIEYLFTVQEHHFEIYRHKVSKVLYAIFDEDELCLRCACYDYAFGCNVLDKFQRPCYPLRGV